MIKEFECFHGLVFARMLHGTQRPLSIRPFQSVSNASYVVNDTIGIYIKYSAKRMTPWRFTFMKDHREEIALLRSKVKKVFLVLVCNDDGVVCLDSSELTKVLYKQGDATEWISAT